MDKENVVCIHDGVVFCHKEQWCNIICRKMDVIGDDHVKWNKPD
jgi:hypothetical protein